MTALKSLKTQLETAVISLPAETPLLKAVREMQRFNVGALLLLNGAGKPVGIFTERDLLQRMSDIIDFNAWDKPIGLVMTKPLKTLPLNRFNEAGEFMLNHHIRHLPLTQAKEIVAMVSMRDLFQNLLKTGEVSIFEHHDQLAARNFAVIGTNEPMYKTLLKLLILEDAPTPNRVIAYTCDEFKKAQLPKKGLNGCILDLDFLNPKELMSILAKLQKDTPHLEHLIALFSPQQHDPSILKLVQQKEKAPDVLRLFPKPIKIQDFFGLIYPKT